MQTEIHTAEPLVAESSAFEMEMTIEKLKSHKSPGMDEIPAELIKAGGRTFALKSELFIRFGKRRNCLRSGRSRALYLFYKKVDKTGCCNYRGSSQMSTTYKILSNVLLSRLTQLHMQRKLLGSIIVDYDAAGQLIIYSAFVKYLSRNKNTMKQCFSYL